MTDSRIFTVEVHSLANVNSCSCSLYVVVRPSVCLSVCRLSITSSVVCNVRAPYSGDWNFGNVSTTFGTLAICDPSVKILRRSSQGNPYVGKLNQRGVEKCNDFGPSKAISRKRCKIRGKLLLITNRKSHMSFRLVPKSVTFNDLERRNGPNGCVISPNSVDFWADCVIVGKDARILAAAEM